MSFLNLGTGSVTVSSNTWVAAQYSETSSGGIRIKDYQIPVADGAVWYFGQTIGQYVDKGFPSVAKNAA